MYPDNLSGGLINTGVPGAFIVVSAANGWDFVAGLTLVMVGGVGALLAIRRARQRPREFAAS